MIVRSEITTDRLVLRTYKTTDGDAVWPVLSHPKLYATTLGLPRPYPREKVDQWFNFIEKQWDEDSGYEFGIFLNQSGEYVGNCGLLGINRRSEIGGISYNCDPAKWGNGYTTEAAYALCSFGFDVLKLNRIDGGCMSINPASRRVMEKVGFIYEGTRKQHIKKDGLFYDEDILGLLREDFITS